MKTLVYNKKDLMNVRKKNGFSLLELMVAVAIATVVIVGFYSAFITFDQMRIMNKNKLKAMNTARAKVEEMQSLGNVQDIFQSYNISQNLNFAVEGLNSRKDDEDGFVGAIVFPVGPDNTIWEDLDMPKLAMPMDLNMDGTLDESIDDFLTLPVLIEIKWRDASGTNSFALLAYLRSTE
ncbi:type II secretion system protein J [Planctomycetota bacterium]